MCERHNAVLAEMLMKTRAEGNCSLPVALMWAIHAKNSIGNVHGFSPYQLAIGYTPELPNVLTNKLPANEVSPPSELVATNLKAIAAARKAFIESESCEKIKRALRHNVQPGSNAEFFTGDSVYYKRSDSNRWKGPGKVLGQDGQQVLIKHGGVYVRVHPCRVAISRNCDSENYENQTHQTHKNREWEDRNIEPVATAQQEEYDSDSSDHTIILNDNNANNTNVHSDNIHDINDTDHITNVAGHTEDVTCIMKMK